MARYYEESALIEFVKLYTPTIGGETTMECVERAIRNAPTADVAPKSEVAREIFEEIENTLEPHIESFTKFHITQKIAELKKKYTEGKE